MGSDACPTQGSAEFVPPGTVGTRVLAMCPDRKLVQELESASGGSVVGSLYLQPPGTNFCSTSGKTLADVKGWARAFQVEAIGDF
jgi:hypothetical protein